MKFTFGIITTLQTVGFLQTILDSITFQRALPDFEVIIVGGNEPVREGNLTIIPFDESIKPQWITRKKNIIIEESKGENIVFLHDYVHLLPNWIEGFEHFDEFNVCVSPIINADGTRFRDWLLDDECVKHILGPEMGAGNPYMLPYDVTHLTRFMYISGAYWVAKREFMKRFPLNEELTWGQGEDVEWSNRAKTATDFKINIHSPVNLLKYKPREFRESTPEVVNKLTQTISGENASLSIG